MVAAVLNPVCCLGISEVGYSDPIQFSQVAFHSRLKPSDHKVTSQQLLLSHFYDHKVGGGVLPMRRNAFKFLGAQGRRGGLILCSCAMVTIWAWQRV